QINTTWRNRSKHANLERETTGIIDDPSRLLPFPVEICLSSEASEFIQHDSALSMDSFTEPRDISAKVASSPFNSFVFNQCFFKCCLESQNSVLNTPPFCGHIQACFRCSTDSVEITVFFTLFTLFDP